MIRLGCVLSAALVFAVPANSAPVGLVERGAVQFSVRCAGCHALHENRTGPKLEGVYGRRAGTVPGYRYSPGVIASGIVWSDASLDTWLANPSAMVRGAKMWLHLKKPDERAQIIAYLRHQ